MYEEIGKLYCDNQRLLGEYRELLGLLQRIKNGEVQIEQVKVDLAKLKWAIEPEGQPKPVLAENTESESK